MQWGAMVLGSLLLTGCTLELAYSNLDRLVLRWLDEKIELTDQQQQQVKQALDEHLAWHCVAHLPAYADLLDNLHKDLSNNSVTHDQLISYGDQIAAFGKDLVIVTRPTAVALLASLSDDQITALETSFEESNQELLDSLSEPDPSQRVDERHDRMIKRFARFMGKPTQAQRDAIMQWSQNYRPITGFQLAYSYEWQSELLNALEIRQSQPAEFSKRITLLFDPGAGWSAPYRKAVTANQEATWQLVSEVLSQLSGSQQRRMMRKLASYSEDFDRLSCQSSEGVVLSPKTKEAPSGSLSQS